MMTHNLDCDSCEYDDTAETETAAYRLAKEHETTHPSHFVLIHGGPPTGEPERTG
jgi:hypothetical protein